ncbi:MAG: hypothetical protein AAFW66_08680 [Pseudomonadota bacterium]
MIIGILRVLYFFGPVLALALIFMPGRKTLAWYFWGFAAAIVAFHWLGFLTAQEDNATEIGIFGIATWTPLILTTALAGLTEKSWRGWHSNPFVSQGLISLICLLPSIIAFFLTR